AADHPHRAGIPGIQRPCSIPGGPMSRKLAFRMLCAFTLSLALGVAALAQGQPAPAPAAPPSTYATPIGAPIGLEAAKRVAAAASAEAHKNKWLMAIAVVDPAGVIVYYE